jgi:short-subunit dehydrogenase
MIKRKDRFFHDKVAVVTGSSQGIGKATALKLLEAGARVVINGRDPENLRKTGDEFNRLGFRPLEVAGDLSDFSFCEELVRRTIDHFERIDILINNAGGGFRGKFEMTKPDVFRNVIDANLMTPIYCTKAALEKIKQTKGSIVFISSLSAIHATPGLGPYNIAKMGLTALAQTLKAELYGTGVHIGIMMVGLTDYDQNKRVISHDGRRMEIHRKWHQTREDVAEEILKMIRKRKYQVILTAFGKLFYIVHKISPSFIDWVTRISTRTEDLSQ